MSIEASVTRKCLMESPQDFYRFIKDKDKLLEKYIEFKIFRDHLFLSKHGCPCDTEENENVSVEIYKKFNVMDKQAFVEVNEILNSTHIIFKLNSEILFEL